MLSSTGSAIEHWQCYRALAVLAFGRRRHRRLLGWIATWSEPGPTLVIGAIEEEPFDIWPVAQLLGCAHAEQEGAETLTPLLRRKTLIGSGSEECPTCAPNQRRSIQPPVAVTGRVTSEPGCSRETQLTRRTKESHADYNACPLWRADSDRRGRADDHHPTRNPLHHAGRDRTPQGVRPHPHPRGQQRRVDPGLRTPRDRPGGPIRPRGAQRRCVRSSRLRSGGDRDDVHDRGTGGTRPLRCRAWRRSHPTSSTRSSGAG